LGFDLTIFVLFRKEDLMVSRKIITRDWCLSFNCISLKQLRFKGSFKKKNNYGKWSKTKRSLAACATFSYVEPPPSLVSLNVSRQACPNVRCILISETHDSIFFFFFSFLLSLPYNTCNLIQCLTILEALYSKKIG